MQKNHNSFIYMTKVLLLCIAFCLVIFSLLFISSESTRMTKAALLENNQTPLVIIDAGHGGRDGGASSKDGILEKDLNLSLANALNDIFNICGVSTVMTRNEDSLVCDENNPELKGKYKLTDLNNRLSVSKLYPEATFVSIHMNKFPIDKYNGLQVYFSPNNERSLPLAQTLQKKVVEYLQPENKRQVKKAESNIFLLNRIDSPAILIECGFLSNAEDTKKLVKYSYQTKLSLVFFDSIMLNLMDNWNN